MFKPGDRVIIDWDNRLNCMVTIGTAMLTTLDDREPLIVRDINFPVHGYLTLVNDSSRYPFSVERFILAPKCKISYAKR